MSLIFCFDNCFLALLTASFQVIEVIPEKTAFTMLIYPKSIFLHPY
jgi:hypothetical protein